MARGGEGEHGHQFPGTRLSLLQDVTSEDDARRRLGWDRLVTAYWRPVYKHLRLRLSKSDEDAQDLTQGFFAAAMERDFFLGFDPDRGRFRTFLRTCVDRFASNQDRGARALRRGGDRLPLPFDFAELEREMRELPMSSPASSDAAFEREWRRGVFARALHALEVQCQTAGRERRFEVFRRYDLSDSAERPRYDDVALALGLTVSVVTNEIFQARQALRAILVGILQDETATQREFEDDLESLLGGSLQ
jgi:RNA polymerase sigma factor (sigma-70 family)